jgi:hypothetical protein
MTYLNCAACNRGENSDPPAASVNAQSAALTTLTQMPAVAASGVVPTEEPAPSAAGSAAAGEEAHARHEHRPGDVEHERRRHESK